MSKNFLTFWRPAAFGDFQKKKTSERTWLCAGISLLLFKAQKPPRRQGVNMSVLVSKLSFYTDVNPCDQKKAYH